MEQPWKLVLKEMQNILDIHPQIKGIQVMNDQGAYLIKGYAGKNKWAINLHNWELTDDRAVTLFSR